MAKFGENIFNQPSLPEDECYRKIKNLIQDKVYRVLKGENNFEKDGVLVHCLKTYKTEKNEDSLANLLSHFEDESPEKKSVWVANMQEENIGFLQDLVCYSRSVFPAISKLDMNDERVGEYLKNFVERSTAKSDNNLKLLAEQFVEKISQLPKKKYRSIF